MKPDICGKTISMREVTVDDAEFILKLRTDPEKNKYLSPTTGDVESQRKYISTHLKSETDYYFVITDMGQRPVGTVRIYDIRNDSFCWGSWILSNDAPRYAALETALLIYDFAFFFLHYSKSHFEVRKENEKVIFFHKRLGAQIVSEDEQNFYFEYTKEAYLIEREKYHDYLP